MDQRKGSAAPNAPEASPPEMTIHERGPHFCSCPFVTTVWQACNDPATQPCEVAHTVAPGASVHSCRGIRGGPGWFPGDDNSGGNVHQRSVVKVGASLLIASLALSACGSRGSSTSSPSSGNKTAVIGIMAPLSGNLSALGLGIQNSVMLAVSQANASNAIPGWTLKVEAKDDQGVPDVGKNAATAFAGEPAVAGVVGNLNSSVSQSTQPVLATAKIVQVSPANTNTSLTQGANFSTAPVRTYATYFRTCTTDSVQGPFAAQYLFTKAGLKKIATIHDKKTYGQGLVAAFTKQFTTLGGTVTAAETINPDDSNFQAVISKVKPTAPEAIYYGGEYPQAGPLSQQMKAAGR